MFVIETAKRTAEKLTGLGRPGRQDLLRLRRARKPNLFRFKDDGVTPNNPDLPMVVYRSPVRLSEDFDPAAVLEELFHSNGWRDAWRNGVYDYLHHHSQIHEALGVARGHLRVQFGGRRGRVLDLKAGDIVIMPAGTGHKRVRASRDALVVGAYPRAGKYDECRPNARDHDEALHRIPKVAPPKSDPVYGRNGPLVRLWAKA